MAMVLLAAAVFGWGLQYKLSLYQASVETVDTAPAAKLLTARERIGESEEAASEPSSKPPLGSLLFLVLVVTQLFSQHGRHLVELMRGRRISPRSAVFDTALFVRPPPTCCICA